jgi:small neutral amino acid transporter SnatA (MarC family)
MLKKRNEIALTPLAIPMLAGPGSILLMLATKTIIRRWTLLSLVCFSF